MKIRSSKYPFTAINWYWHKTPDCSTLRTPIMYDEEFNETTVYFELELRQPVTKEVVWQLESKRFYSTKWTPFGLEQTVVEAILRLGCKTEYRVICASTLEVRTIVKGKLEHPDRYFQRTVKCLLGKG